jgi:hypothetical protein
MPVKLTGEAARIFDNVLAAMQDAEEMGGASDVDYVALMGRISEEAGKRVRAFLRAKFARERGES